MPHQVLIHKGKRKGKVFIVVKLSIYVYIYIGVELGWIKTNNGCSTDFP